jgi:hypothetical protein
MRNEIWLVLLGALCSSASLAQDATTGTGGDFFTCRVIAGVYADRAEVSGDIPELRRSLGRLFAQLLGKNPFPLVKKGISTITETEIRFVGSDALLITARFPDGTSIDFKSDGPAGFECNNGSLVAAISLDGHSEGQTSSSSERFEFSRVSSDSLRMIYSRDRQSRYLFIPSSDHTDGQASFFMRRPA